MKNNLTIIVNSCDKYEDLWYPFFELFRINWPNCEYPIILNTESKVYNHPTPLGYDIKCLQLYKDKKNVPWGKRLIETLKHVETEYILFLLDDFFLQKPIKLERIKEICSFLDKDKKLGYFTLFPVSGPNVDDKKYPEFERRTKEAPWLCNCDAAIWRKQCLLDLVKSDYSPWEFEELGSERAKKTNWTFYSYISPKGEWEQWDLIYSYSLYPTWGYGVYLGKWLFNNEKLFLANGIHADFSKHGRWESREQVLQYLDELKKNQNQEENKVKKFIKKLIPNKLLKKIRKVIHK